MTRVGKISPNPLRFCNSERVSLLEGANTISIKSERETPEWQNYMKNKTPSKSFNYHSSATNRIQAYVLSLLLMACALGTTAMAQTAPPNIVVILADDLGYGDVGFNGCPDIPTPNIDSVATNGALCTNGYATHCHCSPSRAAIMTGRYQQRFGHDSGPETDNDNPRLGLPLEEVIFPQLLKPAGYICGAIGKWHLGFAPGLLPTERGFDEFFGFPGAKSKYYDARLLRDKTPVTESEYLTDAFTREGVDFINRHAATGPFFLYLAYNAVHEPYDQPPDVYMQRVANIPDPARRIYAAMVVALDEGVGQVLQALEANNILDNTLIFFLSDNGAFETGFTETSNYPLRGYKLDMLEGGIRVPFAIQWAKRVPPNLVYDGVVSSMDILATSAAAAGVTLPMDRVYDGLDLTPYLSGEQISPKRTLFWRWLGLGPDGPLGALNTIWAVRSGQLKLVVERAKDDQPPALYNLTNDIGETVDLAAVQPQQVDLLRSRFAQWTLDTIPDLWQKDSDALLLPLVLAGDWNGFNKSDPNEPWKLTRVTSPDLQGTPDAYNWFKSTIRVATTGGDTTPGVHTFTLVGQDSYSTQWGGATINIDQTTDIPFFSGASLGPTNKIVLDDGFYYSMRIVDCKDQPGATLKLAVMKTSAPPVSVSRIGQTPAQPMPDDPITISIASDQAKSAEERIYLRWSTDLFLTSHLVEAEGSALSYTAIIPAQPKGLLILYTIITSTADLTASSTSGVIDSLILATTGVFNAMPPVLPSITAQPSDKTVGVGHTTTFSVKAVGTKPFRYQWKKNGTNIVGAIKAYYSTPPTTLEDNGALFSVIVSGRAGSVMSRSATLTVVP